MARAASMVENRTPAQPEPLTRRERNKQDKRLRILAAARDAFRERGYDNTTLREVAAAAGVGSGTVFLYAETKESLLLQVFKAEMAPIFDDAFSHVPAVPLHRQLVHVLKKISDHHARDPAICKPFVGQLLFIGSPEREALLEFIEGLYARLRALIVAARERGEVAQDADAHQVAVVVQDLFLSGLRRWLINGVPRAQFDRDLDAALGLVLAGAAPRDVAPVASPVGRRSRPAKG